MKNKQKKRVDFLPNKQNKYSIRKFTVGTASILVGTALIFGSAHDEAKAAEKDQASTTIDTSEAQDVKAKGHVQTSESATLSQVKPEQIDTTKQNVATDANNTSNNDTKTVNTTGLDISFENTETQLNNTIYNIEKRKIINKFCS
ncbi:YSIRK-type signal peptide-containing protein [Staphylococcus haemolyticus]|uniref:YSIRK-type signal peptide-containing protein n=1 Tax=Staphylococcus sp. GDX8P54P TaxID=2804099 RepID=UPI00187F9CED|nr:MULTISPECIES: YSIRK-type signal peptide-containing protein [unclassified Staphylococcus]MBF2758246.1 YSIRK-type signal peptide-containing protein [Staphylococcus haemolyticus]MBF2774727.1 YSIRK-type signal peptide-containing protein [Staphylococcus haemolyticus]MBF2777083.1 YSIRK-type signal peptide-containing protein [Staphylococcus haemolyticus]MBF2816066.1 YSIRK-type signal peptide-containing protein [Staphylococcus haemolyticus]MBF9720814.1 YSIRK-type signal peptide-containing protein [